MILVDKSRIAAFSASGAWGRVTLDGLVRKNAKSHPDALALADAPDRASWTGGAARQLTFAELEREVDETAALLAVIGLDAGAVVGLQAPNTVDTIIVLLAALRAGLIVTPLSLTWREADIRATLDILGAKAAIAVDRIESQRPADYCRNAARKLFGIRHVLGLGEALPDGVLSLADLRREAGPVPPVAPRTGADDVATVTWAAPLGGDPVPLPRSHNQWIAAGLMQMIEARFEMGTKIVSPYAPNGLVGLAAVIAPWLLSGAELHLHHFRSLDGLAEHALAVGADHLFAPAPLVDPLAARLARGEAQPARITAVWANGHPSSNAPIAFDARIDLTNLGDYAYVSARRHDDGPAALPLGALSTPSAGEAAPVLLETRLGPEGFAVKGPMVPDVGWPGNRATPIRLDDKGFVMTGLAGAALPEDPDHARPTAHAGPSCFAGGALVDPASLDRLYSECPEVEEGAAFFIDDPVLGARLAAALVQQDGETASAEALQAYLDDMRVAIDKRPVEVVLVPEIPREVNGSVDREELAFSCRR